MKGALDVLARRITYEVPEQDLRIAFSRLPALPRSHFVIRGVRTVADVLEPAAQPVGAFDRQS